MANLNINYDDTISVGTQITAKGEEFETLLRNIVSINEELKSYWQGSDGEAYASKVEEQAMTMQKLAEIINETGIFLQQVGNAYKEATENNTL